MYTTQPLFSTPQFTRHQHLCQLCHLSPLPRTRLLHWVDDHKRDQLWQKAGSIILVLIDLTGNGRGEGTQVTIPRNTGQQKQTFEKNCIQLHTQTDNRRTLQLSEREKIRCHVSCVRCHLLRVTCYVSPVTCHMSLTPTTTATHLPPANFPTMHRRMLLLIVTLIHKILA